MKLPDIPAIWLIPIAIPPWCSGIASVKIAVELAISHLLDSVSAGVVSHATCSVLVVHLEPGLTSAGVATMKSPFPNS